MNHEQVLDEIYRTLSMEEAALRHVQEILDSDAAFRAVQMIADCRGRIILSGCGTSAMAARKIAHSLCCIERPALFLSPSDAVHGALGVVQPGDILILISKGGKTKELLPLRDAALAKNARLIIVTENPLAPITRNANLVLQVAVEREPCRFNMLATASTLAVIAVFDAICIALMSYTGYTREQFARIHPGGAVGERLLSGEENTDAR